MDLTTFTIVSGRWSPSRGRLSSILEANLWLSTAFDMIVPNASKLAIFVPGPRGFPLSSRTPGCFATALPP